uniref:Uncharacterized protein n=1 Tax=Vibrio sp. 1S_269 TaxID=1652828 RepID=A0A0H3ZXV3_9VIBR|nr:hypothetical protein [Vibrio sp. 1S_269]
MRLKSQQENERWSWLMLTFLCCITQPVIRILLPVINVNVLNDRIIRAYGCWVAVVFLVFVVYPYVSHKNFFIARFLQWFFAQYFTFRLLINMSITWSFEQSRNDSFGFSSF